MSFSLFQSPSPSALGSSPSTSTTFMLYGPGLGAFVFERTEIPGSFPFAGTQMLSVHNMVGGGRIAYALGPIDRDLEWRGIFLGTNAMARAKKINAARLAGKPLYLIMGNVAWKVALADFEPDYRFVNYVPYRIRLIALSETWNNPAKAVPTTSKLSAFQKFLGEAQSLGTAISSTVSAIVSDIQSVTDTLSAIDGAANAVISQITGGLEEITNTVDGLKATIEDGLQNITTLGGIFPNNPAAAAVNSLNNQMNLAMQDYQAENLSAITLNASNTLNTVGPVLAPLVVPTLTGTTSALATTRKQIVPAATDLSTLALQYYGDASQWMQIANTNGLLSPIVPETMEITIPPFVANQSGVAMPGFLPEASGSPGSTVFVGPFITPELNILGEVTEGSGLTASTGASALPIDILWPAA
ncbi:hypothetical protein [Leptospirillum ferriphilum]|uniref:hypothetical protein n=1 Tax=Leptospirillum ferriphilum TaxID=178606 RepID=UPI000987697F|nr:hypothetical protein [Leptospirillum ferriphilum]OOH80794.1 hypothetical protein BOX30_05500 [Leptospirillum ferriphilum]